MRIAKGKVVDGKVVFEGEPLPEGSSVSVWAEEGSELELDEQSLDALAAADASCERGEGLTLDQLVERLRRVQAA